MEEPQPSWYPTHKEQKSNTEHILFNQNTIVLHLNDGHINMDSRKDGLTSECSYLMY